MKEPFGLDPLEGKLWCLADLRQLIAEEIEKRPAQRQPLRCRVFGHTWWYPVSFQESNNGTTRTVSSPLRFCDHCGAPNMNMATEADE